MVTRSGALPRLQRRFLAPLSNGNIGLMLDLAKHGRLPWDANFGAEIAQAYKPSPDAYLRNAEARRGSSRNAFVSSRRIIMTWRRGVADFAPAQGEHGPDQATDLQPAC